MDEPVAKQVLRYWLACVRMEEALGARPRARRTPTQSGPPRIELAQPVDGVEYVRVPCDGAMWELAAQQRRAAELRVPLDAAKPEIKAAIEGLFDVKVTAVNTLRQKGKVKRFRGRLGKRPDVKKAIITLAEGEIVDVTAKI